MFLSMNRNLDAQAEESADENIYKCDVQFILHCRLKNNFCAGDVNHHRKVTAFEVFNLYTAEEITHKVTKREFGHIIHKIHPNIKAVNGPTINNKRATIYAGLIKKDKENGYSFLNHITLDHTYAREPLKVIDALPTSMRYHSSDGSSDYCSDYSSDTDNHQDNADSDYHP